MGIARRTVLALTLASALAAPGVAQETCRQVNYQPDKGYEYTLKDHNGRKVAIVRHKDGSTVALGYVVKGTTNSDSLTIEPLPIVIEGRPPAQDKQAYDSALGYPSAYAKCTPR